MIPRLPTHFDSYSRTARLAPGLLLLLAPAAVALGAGISQRPLSTSLLTSATISGLPMLLADWVRRRGQRLQRQLWDDWGGNPVVQQLKSEGLVAARRRDQLAEATGLPVRDPSSPEFDEAINNAVRRLIAATRDRSRHPLVFAENKSYGFARNVLAVRGPALAVCIASLGSALGILLLRFKMSDRISADATFALGAAALMTAIWIWYPTDDRVRQASSDYRDRLLEALDSGAFSVQNASPFRQRE